MKIGLYVGSFNPITLAHENIAKDLLDNNILDFLYFIPVNSDKTNLLQIEKRIDLISLIKNNKEEILNIYKYSENGLFNYSILNKIQSDKNITHLIMGSDLFLKFNTFENYKKILNEYKIIIVNRNNKIQKYARDNYNNYIDKIIIIDKKYPGSSILARKNLLLNKNNYLNDKVFDYIRENILYK